VPSIDLFKDPFLTEAQQGVLDTLAAPGADIGLISHEMLDIEKALEDVLHEAQLAIGSMSAFVARNRRTYTRDPKSYEELERKLQVKAVAHVAASLMLGMCGRVATLLTAESVASGEDMETIHAFNLSHTLAERRAQGEVGALLSASSLLLIHDEQLDEKQSLWDMAIDTHKQNPRLRAPVSFTDEEQLETSELVHRMREFDRKNQGVVPFKLSRSKLINMTRAGRQAAKMFRGIPDDRLLEQMEAIVATTITPVVPKLSEEKIIEGNRLTHRYQRYIASAARANLDIATDPRARHLIFLGQQLVGHDLQAERRHIEGSVQKRAHHMRRVMQQRAANSQSDRHARPEA
jgi:hypothetical protein